MNFSNPPPVSSLPIHFQTRNYEVPEPHHLLCAADKSPAEPIVPCLCFIRRTKGHYTQTKLVLRFYAAE